MNNNFYFNDKGNLVVSALLISVDPEVRENNSELKGKYHRCVCQITNPKGVSLDLSAKLWHKQHDQYEIGGSYSAEIQVLPDATYITLSPYPVMARVDEDFLASFNEPVEQPVEQVVDEHAGTVVL
jgi:hypothetical protein